MNAIFGFIAAIILIVVVVYGFGLSLDITLSIIALLLAIILITYGCIMVFAKEDSKIYLFIKKLF